MMRRKIIFLILVFLLVFPLVNAGVETEQLNSLIKQIKTGIPFVQMKNKNCFNSALSLLHNRMDEMVGVQAAFLSVFEGLTPTELLKNGLPLPLRAVYQKFADSIKEKITEGSQVIGTEYEGGWSRAIFGDECDNFNMQFLWMKDLNIIKVISSGNCNCKYGLRDFYMQFDVSIKENERLESDNVNRYQLSGFTNVHPYEYFEDSEAESNSVMYVNCCRGCPDKINYENEEEVGFSAPRKNLFADPDEFLASLESGAYVPSQKEREDFLRGTLCSKTDAIPIPTSIKIPDSTRTPTKTPDVTKTPTTDPTKTPTSTSPPILPTKTPTKTPTPTIPPVISTATPITPIQTPIDCNQVCASKGWNTQKQDFSSYIFSTVNQYTCVSGAKITQPGSYKMGPCICYDPNEKPKIEIDTKIPLCKDTFCGDVPCGERRTCEEPGAAYSATCNWQGWKMSSSGLPSPFLEVT